MFAQLWNKYLPVIRLLLKKSALGEQTLNMNKTDFERAAGGKKLKHSFKIHIRGTKLENAPKQSQLVKQFATTLIEDEVTKGMLRQNEYQFILNTSFQLTIKNCNPPTQISKDEETPQEKDNIDQKDETVDSPVETPEEIDEQLAK
jgi:hypothetical protein